MSSKKEIEDLWSLQRVSPKVPSELLMDTEQSLHSTSITNSLIREIGTGQVFACSYPESNNKSVWKENVSCHEKGDNLTRRRELSCQVCPQTFRCLASFLYHMSNHHSSKLLCPLCSFLCLSLTEYMGHIRAHGWTQKQKSSGPKTAKRAKFTCATCLKSFNSVSGIWCHKKSHCTSNWSAVDETPIIFPSFDETRSGGTTELLMENFNIEGETWYGCTICRHRTKQRGNLKTHFLVHTDHRPFGCLVQGCTYRAKSFQHLKNHSRVAHQINNLRPQKNAKTPHENLGLTMDYDNQFQLNVNFSMAFACMLCEFIGDSVSAALEHAQQHKP